MEAVGISALIALFSLDQKHAFQFALTQPLIMCSIIGLITGQYQEAIYFGLFVQLVWLGNLPVGASTTPEGNVASAIGCLLYTQFAESYLVAGHFLLLAVFVFVVVVSFAGGLVDTKVRNLNISLLDYMFNQHYVPGQKTIGRVVVFSLLIQFGVSFAFVLSAYGVGKLMFLHLQSYLTADMAPLYKFVDIAIMGIGVGLVMSVYKGRRLKKIILAVSIFGLLFFKMI